MDSIMKFFKSPWGLFLGGAVVGVAGDRAVIMAVNHFKNKDDEVRDDAPAKEKSKKAEPEKADA